MKYIRTKNGKIINLKKLGCSKKVIDNPLASKDLKLILDTYGHGEIIKQADTIEELCDYIVYNEYAENSNGKLMFKKISVDCVKEQLKNVMLDGGGNVKLAILTDKGLIYVAKMNDKGALELL